MKIGIDRLSFYTSNYYVDLKTLADARSVDHEKYYVGIGQEKMGIPPPDEDVVTLAASAAYPLMQEGELDDHTLGQVLDPHLLVWAISRPSRNQVP